MNNLSDLHKVLDVLEDEESKLLTWGDTGGYFSEDEILDFIQTLLPDDDPEDIFEELEDHAIIFPVVNGSSRTEGYRTRMGEAVHLYRNLRQWFHNKSIEESSTLVSDFRFLRRRRHYPERNLNLSELIDEWSVSLTISDTSKSALKLLVGEYELSGFQSRATQRILQAIPRHLNKTKIPTGTITCAGTGSGKTMAFYLPALSWVATDVYFSPDYRVRVLAIYPRKELLKDQFNEAWEQCRRLDTLLQSKRKLRIGALFGDTPEKSEWALKGNAQYLSYGLLKCVKPNCAGEMRWNKEDIDRKTEILTCHLCGHTVTSDEVALTRESMEKKPPDILFTTTEMLNQQMGNPYRHRLFGIKTKEPIPMVLLDEVHTYSGTQGAQTAYLLRRWMQLTQSAPHFVGLSATLADAESFFARLTGCNPDKVRLIGVVSDEMTEEGAEYLLALRGDPVSQTALLSTTIQTTMLTRRMQDSRRGKKSSGTWGSKTFVFTDDLDVNNRLFSQLADAEGLRQKWKGVEFNPVKLPLAILRNHLKSNTTREKLVRYGQDWSASKLIGHKLDEDDRSAISKTSSQDSGVDPNSEVVVATASLEVGFNDPEVGAIIQHKAPRDVSSYLQRKGRAGRLRITRPWMLIILSEFGRDRVTYQHYEKLLDPEIKLQSLPLDNSHIQRMQAAMATLDWFVLKVPGFNPWSDFNNPKRKLDNNKREKLLKLIEKVLDDSTDRSHLINYLANALAIEESELNKLLWQPPRSIFLEFLPTIRKRLVSKWGRWSSESQEIETWGDVTDSWGSPVREFIPDNLFSDLNLPTLHIYLSRGQKTSLESMMFFQGLKEFAPGRISKRFSTHMGSMSDWVIPNDLILSHEMHGSKVSFEIEQAFGKIKTFIDEIKLSGQKITIFQPHYILTSSTNKQPHVGDSSNASLQWHSAFRPMDGAEIHQIPKGSIWSSNFLTFTFFLHKSLTQLEVIRFNTGSKSEFKFKSGARSNIQFDWVVNDEPAGIGTRLLVDAARLEFRFTESDLNKWLTNKELIRSLRVAYFQDNLRDAEIFDGNKFDADWIHECFIAAVSLEVLHSKCNVKNAIENICSNKSNFALEDIPSILFQQELIGDYENNQDSDETLESRDQKLQKKLKELLISNDLLELLQRLGHILYDNVNLNSDFLFWCKNVIGNTLSAGVQQSICSLLPDVDERDLIVDPVFDKDQLTIWVCEKDSGGTGVITQLQDSYISDPLQILNILAHSIQTSDYEQLDADLIALLSQRKINKKILKKLESVRKSNTFKQRITSGKELKQTLIDSGFQFSHSFSAVLYSRILRPGSSENTDDQLEAYLESWQQLEKDLGFEIPLNIISLIISTQLNPSNDSRKIFSEACRIQSVLWPRGSVVRQSTLSFYNQFNPNNNRTERLLVEPFCADIIQTIEFNEKNPWLERVHKVLNNEGRVELLVPREFNSKLTEIVSIICVAPLDTFGLLLYPRVSTIRRNIDYIILRLELAERVTDG